MKKLEHIQASREEVYEIARKDFNFFSALILPDVCVYDFPPFYVSTFFLIVSKIQSSASLAPQPDTGNEDIEDAIRLVIGLPRGHAKTTFVKLLITYLIVYDYISFPLVVCANADLAKRLLADIDTMLQSRNAKALYGDWDSAKSIDSKEEKKALYHGRPVAIVAVGWSSGIRGLNIDNMRPDLILCDDVQTKLNDESAIDREKLKTELVGTIFKAITPDKIGIIIYLGNMYSDQCILNQLRNSPMWISIITGAILADGQALWPERHPLPKLLSQYKNDVSLGLGLLWFAEVMNDPTGGNKTLLPNPLPPCTYSEIISHDGAFIVIDPAGFKDTSDDNVIILAYKYNNIAIAVDFVKGILDPQEIIRETLRLAIEHNVSLIGIEDVGYQMTLGYWMNFFMERGNITNIRVVPLKPKGRSKESRIRLSVQALYNKTTVIKDPTLRAEYEWQASKYRIGIKDNKDDLLDALAYIEDVRNEYWEDVTIVAALPSYSNARVIAHAPF